MSSVRRESWAKSAMKGPPESPHAGWAGRVGATVAWPFKMTSSRMRSAWLADRVVRSPMTWFRFKPFFLTAAVTLLALCYLLAIIWSFLVIIFDQNGLFLKIWNITPNLNDISFFASLGLNTAITVGGVALATAAWFGRRFNRVYRFYKKKARRNAKELVRAGEIINRVVGRDRLCDVLMGDLRDPGNRRPHLIIGSIGSGKTALLVRLVERLAKKGAVPIVIQLRDCQDIEDLDFCELAQETFSREIDEILFHKDEADRVWRRLRQVQDRVVVLADGLEEALKNDPDRDNKIRRAIAKADDDRLPLVITARPHGSLHAVSAALTYLEPLNEEAALQYVSGSSDWRSDPRRLDWVIEAANVAEAPIYLEIARELEEKSLLAQVTEAGDELSDPHDTDEWALRTDLLDAWVDALIDGEIYDEITLTPESRAMVIENLSALACIGLRSNNAIVPLHTDADSDEDKPQEATERPRSSYAAQAGDAILDGSDPYLRIEPIMKSRRRKIVSFDKREGDSLEGEDSWQIRQGHVDMQALQMNEGLAVAWGARMGLVENLGNRVRFHHTVMQAFLGSRFLEAFIEEDGVHPTQLNSDFFDSALQNPGRELIMALIFYSRSHTLECKCDDETNPICPIAAMRDRLMEAANDLLKGTEETFRDAMGLGEAAGGRAVPKAARREGGAEVVTYTTTLKVDRTGQWPLHRTAVDQLQRIKPAAGGDGAGPDRPPLSFSGQHDQRVKALEMYAAALDIDSFDEWSQHRKCAEHINEKWRLVGRESEPEQELDAAKMALIERMGASARLADRHRTWLKSHNKYATAYDLMLEMGADDRARAVRLAIAQEIGRGGNAAYTDLTPRPLDSDGDQESQSLLSPTADFRESEYNFTPPPGEGRAKPDKRSVSRVPPPPWGERVHRKLERDEFRENRRWEVYRARNEQKEREVSINRRVMVAWILPMLVLHSDMMDHNDSPQRYLTEWVRRAVHKEKDPAGEEDELPIQRLQLALAQGFKQAANNRPRRGHSTAARTFLRERTLELLRGTHFWFARMTLLQALTLWDLRSDPLQEQPMRGRGSQPSKQVKSWLEERIGPYGDVGREAERHPLVLEAGRLARRTLQSGRPDLFMWMDEVDVVSRIGSTNPSLNEPRIHNRWIAPSAGWSTLDARSLQLLADVLVMTVLTQDRGDDSNCEALLRQADRYGEPFLPVCLAKDRAPLSPQRTVALKQSQHAGDNCADGCPFRLCPYPPKGPECRVELSELFCSYQRSLLNRWQPAAWLHFRFRRRGRWQRRVSITELRFFWSEMRQRARDQA